MKQFAFLWRQRMSTGNQPAPNPTWMSFVGWIITLLPALGLIASGALKLILSGALKWINFKPEGVPDVGWPESALFGLGIVEIGCAILYLLPRTAVVGAVLVTGYLGGAVAHHVRG